MVRGVQRNTLRHKAEVVRPPSKQTPHVQDLPRASQCQMSRRTFSIGSQVLTSIRPICMFLEAVLVGCQPLLSPRAVQTGCSHRQTIFELGEVRSDGMFSVLSMNQSVSYVERSISVAD